MVHGYWYLRFFQSAEKLSRLCNVAHDSLRTLPLKPNPTAQTSSPVLGLQTRNSQSRLKHAGCVPVRPHTCHPKPLLLPPPFASAKVPNLRHEPCLLFNALRVSAPQCLHCHAAPVSSLANCIVPESFGATWPRCLSALRSPTCMFETPMTAPICSLLFP